MEQAIKVGDEVNIDESSTEALGNLIDKIFTSGSKNNMDQSTIVEALGVIPSVVRFKGTEGLTIRDCMFQGSEKKSKKVCDSEYA